jgi:hypothetical protein
MAYVKSFKKADPHFCLPNKDGHKFHIVDKKTAIEIRETFPEMRCALWQCRFCDKVIESM